LLKNANRLNKVDKPLFIEDNIFIKIILRGGLMKGLGERIEE